MIFLFFCVLNVIFMVSAGPFKKGHELFDKNHGVKMGVPDGGCDDAKTNLFMDWTGDSVNYTCFNPTTPFIPDTEVQSILHCDNVPNNYYPKHHCMNEKLNYETPLPTHGDHRPLWPKYGEYRFVPRERWLHNIEHGAVVMLYDPCVLDSEVDKLRKIVRSCIKKHVITPTTFLTRERPMALISWGCRLEFSKVIEQEVRDFIIEKGLNGPEGNMPKDGQYDYELILSSSKLHGVAPTAMNDGKLCVKDVI